MAKYFYNLAIKKNNLNGYYELGNYYIKKAQKNRLVGKKKMRKNYNMAIDTFREGIIKGTE